jgi:predicted PurR-regulated permease PerM
MQSESEARLWKQITLFLITLGVLLVVALIIKPFLAAIVGAIVIAVVTNRPFQWLTGKIASPNLRAATALFLIILSIIVPTFFLTQSVGEQIADVVSALRSESTHQQIAAYFSRHPTMASRILTLSNSIDLPQTTRSAAAFFGSKLAGVIGGSVAVITQMVVMLFILFFLYRDHGLAAAFVPSLLPLEENESSLLLERLRGTINATALGRLTIAAIQGALGGLAYWALGDGSHGDGSSLWSLPCMGPDRSLSWLHWPLGKGGAACRVGRRYRQHHRQFSLSRDGWSATPPTHGRGAAFDPRRNCAVWGNRHYSRPACFHDCDDST